MAWRGKSIATLTHILQILNPKSWGPFVSWLCILKKIPWVYSSPLLLATVLTKPLCTPVHTFTIKSERHGMNKDDGISVVHKNFTFLCSFSDIYTLGMLRQSRHFPFSCDNTNSNFWNRLEYYLYWSACIIDLLLETFRTSSFYCLGIFPSLI